MRVPSGDQVYDATPSKRMRAGIFEILCRFDPSASITKIFHTLSRSDRNAISPSALRGDVRVNGIGAGNVAAGMGVTVGARVAVGVGTNVGVATSAGVGFLIAS